LTHYRMSNLLTEGSQKVMLRRTIVFAALCLTAVGLNAVHSKAQQEQTFFKITYLETRHLANGEDKIMDKRIRFVDPPSGQWKETVYSPEGEEKETTLISRQGYFKIKKGSLDLIGEFFQWPSANEFLEEIYKRDSFGTDNILGFIAYGKKIGASQDEIWTTPELGSRVPLRLVNHAPDGVGYCSLEAVEISRELEPANFFDPPDLPMDLSVLNRWLEKARADGNQAAVERYSRWIAMWQK
jgi:hypothetical protein